jgi:5-methylcytosine-specific restriction endonuclease McrA
MPRRNRTEVKSWYEKPEPWICPICDREIPDSQLDAHHLVPKSRGGRKTEYLHRICHRQIHALFTETELARHYFTAEAILEHPEIQKFVTWIRKKPPGYSDGVKKSKRIREM